MYNNNKNKEVKKSVNIFQVLADSDSEDENQMEIKTNVVVANVATATNASQVVVDEVNAKNDRIFLSSINVKPKRFENSGMENIFNSPFSKNKRPYVTQDFPSLLNRGSTSQGLPVDTWTSIIKENLEKAQSIKNDGERDFGKLSFFKKHGSEMNNAT